MTRLRRWRVTVLVVTIVLAIPLGAMAADVFIDVPDSSELHDDIAWLAENDVTRGCNPPDNTEFCSSDNVTREQMAAFMRRLAGTSGQARAQVTDFESPLDTSAGPVEALTVESVRWRTPR